MRITKKILYEYLLRFVDEHTAKYLADNKRFFQFNAAFDRDFVSDIVFANADKHNFIEIPDSFTEKQCSWFDEASEVVVYAKLPRSFHIPTPVGNYAPDWAIAMQRGGCEAYLLHCRDEGIAAVHATQCNRECQD